MYCDMMRSYVSAINNGAVPAIESAWTYICKNECQKAVSEAYEFYEHTIKEALHNRLPVSTEDLKNFNRCIKERALLIFNKRSLGENEEFKQEFLRRIRARFATIKQENERESNRVCN